MEQIDQLVEIIKEANIEYREGRPSMSDVQYDDLIDQIKALNPKHPILSEVGYISEKSSRKEKLPIPMFSMNKVKSVDEIRKWLKSKKIDGEVRLIVTPKFDGISLCVDETKGSCWTRGDGIDGQRSDEHYLQIPKIGNHDDFLPKITFGEAIISKENWEKHFKGKINPYSGEPYKNARNTVAGFFNSDKPLIELSYIDYMKYGGTFSSGDKWDHIELLNTRNNFEVSKQFFYTKHFENREKDTAHIDLLNILFEKWSKSYEIDGIVIEIDDFNIRKKLGREKNGNPAYARAIKFDHWVQDVDTTITGHKFNISKQGKLKGTVKIDPVILDGTEVTQATFYNARFLSDFILTNGRNIKVKKSGGVIPKITEVEGIKVPQSEDYKSVKEFEVALNKAKEQVQTLVGFEDYQFLQDRLVICPCCDSSMAWDDTFVELICVNPECEDKIISKLVFFFETMGVEDFGEPSIHKFYEAGYTTIDKILSLSIKDMCEVDGYQKVSATTLFNEFDKLANKGVSAAKLFHSLDLFEGVLGEKTCQKIFDDLGEDDSASIPSITRLCEINGVEKTTAEAYLEGWKKFKDYYLGVIFPDLVNITHFQSPIQEIKGDKYLNFSVCMSQFRDEDLSKEIESQGGKVVSGVSKKTTHLLVVDKSEVTGKIKKAMENGIPVLTKEEFLEL